MPNTLTPPESTRGQLGQGIYSLAELRAYLGLSGHPEDGEQALYWLEAALNPVAHARRQPDYSFSDLVSLFVVRELTRKGVKLSRIREAEDYMRRVRKTDRPFVHEDVATDGRFVFFEGEHPDQVESANAGGGQQASAIVVAPYLKKIRVRYSDGAAAAWSPASGVLLDPGVQFGEPVVEGTAVPTSAVAEVAEAAGVDAAARRLGLKLGEARAAARFEQHLSALLN